MPHSSDNAPHYGPLVNVHPICQPVDHSFTSPTLSSPLSSPSSPSPQPLRSSYSPPPSLSLTSSSLFPIPLIYPSLYSSHLPIPLSLNLSLPPTLPSLPISLNLSLPPTLPSHPPFPQPIPPSLPLSLPPNLPSIPPTNPSLPAPGHHSNPPP